MNKEEHGFISKGRMACRRECKILKAAIRQRLFTSGYAIQITYCENDIVHESFVRIVSEYENDGYISVERIEQIVDNVCNEFNPLWRIQRSWEYVPL